ncbi:MAG: ATP-binding protein [Chloroflexota bacterium]
MNNKEQTATHHPTMHPIHLSGPANGDFLCIVGDCIESIFKRTEVLKDSENLIYNIQLAVHETCTNIVDHAYSAKDTGDINLIFSVIPSPLQLVVDVEDKGNAFDPTLVEEPNPEQLQVRGYGLYLIQKLMDKTDYSSAGGVNKWRLTKFLTVL